MKIKQNEKYFYMGDKAKMDVSMRYKIKDEVMSITSTNTDPSLRNQGLAARLLKHVVDYARTHQLKIKPVCPYVVHKFETTPQYQDIWYKA